MPKSFSCESKKNDISSLRNHMLNCLKTPYSKETMQSLLSFQLVSTAPESSEGVLSCWVFNQDSIRKTLACMIINDELPFRFLEGQGFR